MSDDPKLSERYRGLPREEPPRAIDEAILAASRRAVHRRRWYVPIATAAVLMLAVAVTLHVQRDGPSEEVDAASPSMQVRRAPAPAPAAAEARAAEEERKQVGEIAAQSAGARASREEARRAQTQMARAAADTGPEARLERIARLRAAGRHEEADRALADFRKRYPDYRLSDEMKAKVERR